MTLPPGSLTVPQIKYQVSKSTSPNPFVSKGLPTSVNVNSILEVGALWSSLLPIFFSPCHCTPPNCLLPGPTDTYACFCRWVGVLCPLYLECFLPQTPHGLLSPFPLSSLCSSAPFSSEAFLDQPICGSPSSQHFLSSFPTPQKS